jgi:hypothetical protein
LPWAIIDEWLPEEQSDPLKRQLAQMWMTDNTFLLGRYPVSDQPLDKPADRAHEFWQRLLDGLTGGDRNRRGQC